MNKAATTAVLEGVLKKEHKHTQTEEMVEKRHMATQMAPRDIVTKQSGSGDISKDPGEEETGGKEGETLSQMEKQPTILNPEERSQIICQICRKAAGDTEEDLLNHLNSDHYQPRWGGTFTLRLYRRLCEMPNLKINVDDLKNPYLENDPEKF